MVVVVVVVKVVKVVVGSTPPKVGIHSIKKIFDYRLIGGVNWPDISGNINFLSN